MNVWLRHTHARAHTHAHTHTRTRTQVQDTKLLHVAQALLALPQHSSRVYAAIADPLDMMLAQELVKHRQGGYAGAEAAGVGQQHKAQHNAQQLELVCVCVSVCLCVCVSLCVCVPVCIIHTRNQFSKVLNIVTVYSLYIVTVCSKYSDGV